MVEGDLMQLLPVYKQNYWSLVWFSKPLSVGLKGELNHYDGLVYPTCNEGSEHKSLNFRLDSIPNIPDS
jgi:hypothetical protein